MIGWDLTDSFYLFTYISLLKGAEDHGRMDRNRVPPTGAGHSHLGPVLQEGRCAPEGESGEGWGLSAHGGGPVLPLHAASQLVCPRVRLPVGRPHALATEDRRDAAGAASPRRGAHRWAPPPAPRLPPGAGAPAGMVARLLARPEARRMRGRAGRRPPKRLARSAQTAILSA